MQFSDDRTPAQRQSHPILWGGTDTFLSCWGKAEGGQSYAFWACRIEHDSEVERWVRKRGDLKRIRQVVKDYIPSGKYGHCHVYVVEPGHPALVSWERNQARLAKATI